SSRYPGSRRCLSASSVRVLQRTNICSHMSARLDCARLVGRRPRRGSRASTHKRSTRRRALRPPHRRRTGPPALVLSPTYFLGQGTLMLAVDVSPLRNFSSVFPGKPPFGHLLGTLP